MSINLGVGPPPSLDSVSSGSRAFPSVTSIASNTTTTTIVQNPETNSRKGRRHLNRGPLPKHDPTENTEQLRIRQSFSATSFLSMRSLPSNLKPGNISKALTKRKEERGGAGGGEKALGGGGSMVNTRGRPKASDFLTKQKMNLFSHTKYMEVRHEAIRRCKETPGPAAQPLH